MCFSTCTTKTLLSLTWAWASGVAAFYKEASGRCHNMFIPASFSPTILALIACIISLMWNSVKMPVSIFFFSMQHHSTCFHPRTALPPRSFFSASCKHSCPSPLQLPLLVWICEMLAGYAAMAWSLSDSSRDVRKRKGEENQKASEKGLIVIVQ